MPFVRCLVFGCRLHLWWCSALLGISFSYIISTDNQQPAVEMIYIPHTIRWFPSLSLSLSLDKRKVSLCRETVAADVPKNIIINNKRCELCAGPAPYISGYSEESDPDSSHLLYIKDGIWRTLARLLQYLSVGMRIVSFLLSLSCRCAKEIICWDPGAAAAAKEEEEIE